MPYPRYFGGFALAVGLLVAGTSSAFAQDWRYYQQNPYPYQNQYYSRDYNNRYDRIEELQEHIARDRARLDEAIRCGRDDEAARQAADLARDQRLLQDQVREARSYQYWRYDNRRYYNNYNRGWSFSFGWR